MRRSNIPQDRMVQAGTENIARLIAGNYMVALSNTDQVTADVSAQGEARGNIWRQIHAYRINPVTERVEYRYRDTWYKYMAVVRVPNIVQPHMGSKHVPDVTREGTLVTTYRRNGHMWCLTRSKLETVRWTHTGRHDDIMAFVVHKEVM